MTSTNDLSNAFDANLAAQHLLAGRLDVFEDFTETSGLILSLAETYAEKSDEIADASGEVLSGLRTLSVLPKIGTAAKAFSKVYGKVDSAVQNINGRIQELEAKLQDTAGTFLTDLEAAVEKAREISDEGLAINSDYLAAIAQLEAALEATSAGDPDLGLPADLIITALDEITQSMGTVLDATDPVWEVLEAGAEGFAQAAQEMASLEETLCEIRDIAVQIAAPLQEIQTVLEPVDWAINASTEIFDEFVSPVLDPILDATGIEGLLDEFTAVFEPILDDLEFLQDGLFAVDANFDVSFEAGVYTVPFLETLFTGWQDIAPEFSLDTDPFLDIDAYLAQLPSPPNFTFDFDPSLNFNLFTLPTVEFAGFFGDLIDLPEPAFEIDGPEGPSVYWLGLRNVGNVLAATNLQTEVFGSDALIGDDIFVLSLGDDSLNLGINIGDVDVAAFAADLPNFLLTDESDVLQQAGSVLESEGRGEGNELQGNDTIENAEFLLFTDEGLGLVATSEVRNFNYTNVGGNGDVLTGADDNSEREFLIGDAGANSLFGLGGDDVLLGDGGNDNLEGGAGDDLIVGGDGDDAISLFLEAGDQDTIFGGAGDADRIFLEADIDTSIDLEGGVVTAVNGYGAQISGIERATGAGGDDTINLGQDLEERISALGGDDLVLGVGFEDQANGNDGFDIVGFDEDAWNGVQIILGRGLSNVVGVYERPTAVNENEAIIGNFEGAIGTAFGDYIIASYGSAEAPGPGDPVLETVFNGQSVSVTGSFIQGADGNDVIVAGGGDDLLDGGAGFDVLSFDGEFQSGSGVTTSFRPLNINLETGIVQWTGQNIGGAESGTDTIAGFEAVIGTDNNDVFTGNAEDNALYGGNGDDTILGGAGNDIIDGGEGAFNVLDGGDGDDLFYSRSETDVIDGGDGFDVLELKIVGTLPTAELIADEVAQAVAFTDNENTAGAEVDLDAQTITRTIGQIGDPTGSGTATSTVTSIEGAYGTDLGDMLFGSSAIGSLGGSADTSGANLFNGRAGDDFIDGRSGDDVLVGGLGSDTLIGGLGDDTLVANGSGEVDASALDALTGGAGADVFGLDAGANALVTDFEQGVDLLDIRATGATFEDLSFVDTTPPGPVAVLAAGSTPSNSAPAATSTEVLLDGEVIAVLQGVAAGDLSAADVLTSTQAGDDAFALDLSGGGALPDLLANDTESSVAETGAAGLRIAEINGIPIDPGDSIVLQSGAEIVMDAGGGLSLTDPNGVFAGLIGSGEEELVTFDYTVTDDTGGRAIGGVEITVSNTTNPLAAEDDSTGAIDEGTAFVDENVLANDIGQGLSIISATSNAGPVTILPGGAGLRLEPEQNFIGEAVVDYTVEDAFGQRDSAQWRFEVNNIDDDAPETQTDLGVTEGTDPLLLDVLANDSDPEGAPLTITAASAQNGTVSIVNSGTALSYVANSGFAGVDQISYTVFDGTQSASGSASVAVTAPPFGVENDSAATDEDTAAVFTPLENDTGDGLGLISASALNGTVTLLSETELSYVPDPNFFGQDIISYVAGDDYGQSGSGEIAVNVASVNDPPVASPDSATTIEGAAIIINVLANDGDADGDPLTVLSATADNGTVSVLADNQLSYLPDAGFSGMDEIIYLLSDGTETVEGLVDVTVEEENVPPPPTPSQENDSDDGAFAGLGLALGLLALLAGLGGGF